MHLRTWTTHRLPPSMAFASIHSNSTILLLISETTCNQPLFILPYCPPIQFVTPSRISKQDKLKHQFQGDALKQSASIKPAIFEGVHVYVNGYTEPDSLTIKNMLAAHGGVWEQYNGRCNALLACTPKSAAAASVHFQSQCLYLHLLQSRYPHCCEPASTQQNSEISECCKSQERCEAGLGGCLRRSGCQYS
jgi:hypothetical protein